MLKEVSNDVHHMEEVMHIERMLGGQTEGERSTESASESVIRIVYDDDDDGDHRIIACC